jgi:hypothetical protein
MADQDARNQAAERLVEALIKIATTMTAISDAQTRMAELLQAIHTEQREQRAAMVKMAAMIEGKGRGNFRPN